MPSMAANAYTPHAVRPSSTTVLYQNVMESVRSGVVQRPISYAELVQEVT